MRGIGIRIVNVFHAGDGNIHPILLFDERDADQVARVLAASDEILTKCIELGGSVTGEHGIGVEKISFMDKLFTPDDLAVMEAVRDGLQSDGPLEPAESAPHGRRLRHGDDRTQPPGPPGGLVRSHQFRQRPGVVFDEVLRAAVEVLQRRVRRVDAEVVVQRGVDFAERDRAGDRFAGDPVGRADHLARLHAAAGQQGEIHLRPVVAADDGADLRRAAELAPHDDRAILVEPALVQVLDQGADALVEDGEILRLAQEDRARTAIPPCQSHLL